MIFLSSAFALYHFCKIPAHKCSINANQQRNKIGHVLSFQKIFISIIFKTFQPFLKACNINIITDYFLYWTRNWPASYFHLSWPFSGPRLIF